MSTSTFTQLLSSDNKITLFLFRGALRPKKHQDTKSPGCPPRLSHSFRAMTSITIIHFLFPRALYPKKHVKDY